MTKVTMLLLISSLNIFAAQQNNANKSANRTEQIAAGVIFKYKMPWNKKSGVVEIDGREVKEIKFEDQNESVFTTPVHYRYSYYVKFVDGNYCQFFENYNSQNELSCYGSQKLNLHDDDRVGQRALYKKVKKAYEYIKSISN